MQGFKSGKQILYAKLLAALHREKIVIFQVQQLVIEDYFEDNLKNFVSKDYLEKRTKDLSNSKNSKNAISVYLYWNCEFCIDFVALVGENSFLHFSDILLLRRKQIDFFIERFENLSRCFKNSLSNIEHVCWLFENLHSNSIQSNAGYFSLEGSRIDFESRVLLGHPFHPLCKTRLPLDTQLQSGNSLFFHLAYF